VGDQWLTCDRPDIFAWNSLGSTTRKYDRNDVSTHVLNSSTDQRWRKAELRSDNLSLISYSSIAPPWSGIISNKYPFAKGADY
jgi:hypothetical protein